MCDTERIVHSESAGGTLSRGTADIGKRGVAGGDFHDDDGAARATELGDGAAQLGLGDVLHGGVDGEIDVTAVDGFVDVLITIAATPVAQTVTRPQCRKARCRTRASIPESPRLSRLTNPTTLLPTAS
jgi:hypothetical protein